MDFSRAHLGKPLSQLTYGDIDSYFEVPQTESETIEFKSFHERSTFDSGLQGVLKGISAFLNSSGGILIWGAPSGVKQEGYTEDVFVGPLAPVKERKEKDALINKVSSAITPLPVGISVQMLESEGRYVYVFEVQASIYKPHQYETRYYVRLDGQTKPAPHYLVEALMKRTSYPNINGVIKFHPVRHEPDRKLIPITIGIFNFTEFQNEESVYFRVYVAGGFFPKSREQRYLTQRPQYNLKGRELVYDEFVSVSHFGIPSTHDDVISVDTNKTLQVLLSFGGKTSPAKVSLYVLDLANVKTAHPNDMLIEVKENILLAELNKELNKSPENTLKDFSGR